MRWGQVVGQGADVALIVGVLSMIITTLDTAIGETSEKHLLVIEL